MTDDAHPDLTAKWWRVPEIVSWIENSDPIDRPPVARAQALRLLMEAWRTERLVLFGAKGRDEPHEQIPAPKADWKATFVEFAAGEWALDVQGGPAEGGMSLEQVVALDDEAFDRAVAGFKSARTPEPFIRETWYQLFARPDECMRVWPSIGAEIPAPSSKPQARTLQSQFDDEKRRRIAIGEEHGFDAMTLWARHELKVDSATAEKLWENRSGEFSRTAGRSAKRK